MTRIERYFTRCLIWIGIIGVVVLVALIGFWFLLRALVAYPDLDVACFTTDSDITSGATSLSAKIDRYDPEKLGIYRDQDSIPIVSINGLHGTIGKLAFSPDYSLLLFSEDGPFFRESTIVRACNMKTGETEFYLLNFAAYSIQSMSFNDDGSTFIIHFRNGEEKRYNAATGKALK